MRLLLIIAFSVILLPASLSAQSTRYSTWSDPTASAADNAQLKGFIEQLNKLIDDAEKAKAADPVFLRDLRDLANSANPVAAKVLISDSFADGDYTNNPAWEVISGEYFIESGWGLRNRLISAQTQSTSNGSSSSSDDLAKAILGQILKRATKTQSAPAGPTENLIALRTPISNAFSVEVDVSSWIGENHFELGVFQGEQAQIGYRLLYVSGKGIQLHRVGSSGSSVVATTANPVTIEDEKFHNLVWTRSTDGGMRVSLDGTEIISTTDRAFSDPFDGARISDKGGDFIVKQITVRGS